MNLKLTQDEAAYLILLVARIDQLKEEALSVRVAEELVINQEIKTARQYIADIAIAAAKRAIKETVKNEQESNRSSIQTKT